MNHPLSDMMTNSMSKIRDMIDVNTVVGDPITTPGGVTIIPVTKVSIGYGGGGSDFAMKNMPANRDNPFGGGAGAGIKITPVAFLVIRGENVRMLPVAEPASTSVDRLIELLPDLLEKGFDAIYKFSSENNSRPILPKRKPRKRRKKQPKRHKIHAPCKSLCQGDGYARFV